MNEADLLKAATRGNPSFVWRAGQERRLDMIKKAAGERLSGCILENGCGVGEYLVRLSTGAKFSVGLDVELERAQVAHQKGCTSICGVGEYLPFPDNSFDLILSHEVLEHVQNDSVSVREIVRTLKPGGRLVLFCPNRGYPFETHGVYWRGHYRFGNIPLVNYLPRAWRDRLAPHVNIYGRRDLERLFEDQEVVFIYRTVIFGAYDNIIARFPRLGRLLRRLLHTIEHTPLRVFGLSHFWVVEKRGQSK